MSTYSSFERVGRRQGRIMRKLPLPPFCLHQIRNYTEGRRKKKRTSAFKKSFLNSIFTIFRLASERERERESYLRYLESSFLVTNNIFSTVASFTQSFFTKNEVVIIRKARRESRFIRKEDGRLTGFIFRLTRNFSVPPFLLEMYFWNFAPHQSLTVILGHFSPGKLEDGFIKAHTWNSFFFFLNRIL